MTETRWLRADELALWQSFYLGQQDLDRVIGADLSTSGLSHADYAVLVVLTGIDEDAIRVGRLRDWLGWESSRLAHQLRRMERRGLIVRRPASDDGRGTTVTITAEGRQRIVGAAPGHVATVRRYFIDLMSEDEKRVLGAVFARVIQAVAPDRPPLSDLS